ncbi:DUF1853 family protein [Uruburuella testudinis]|uniref:DUF1853 family protein n=1 Tax=Uruburuella testudinis TaxID=1282863 RepID=A0ABY4DV67_9NEIS|nr:DUF1853 family protein [Uruburuella testudinis]UOO82736.1 DUF1853 family protein [Uruburuella testudinis]
MNYALDALWWRLTDPNVRDLASILTAPPLWHSGCELGVRELLGEAGFRCLLALDSNPEPLQQHLAQEAPFGHRLGLYAESLLAFWLNTAPHAQLYARNLSVRDDNGQTLGALDFVAGLNGRLYHIELTCKYYGDAEARPSEMVGLNRSDRLTDKAAKLQQQLAWSAAPQGQTALQAADIKPENITRVSVVRGIGFAAAAATWQAQPLNRYGWHGLYINHTQPWPRSDGLDARYYPLPPLHLLAPARVPPVYALTSDALDEVAYGQVARLELRPDGCWHETARIMRAKAV